jgi:hypothetical protein
MKAEAFMRHDLEAMIVKRSWQDEAFRKEFTTNPADAFGKYLQVPTASLPKIVVHEETPGSWHIVLPPKPANIAELSDAELEAVAGGTSNPIWSIASLLTISATVSLIEGDW